MKSFKEFLQEAPVVGRLPTTVVNTTNKYLGKVQKGEPVGTRVKPKKPRRNTGFKRLPAKIKAIIGTNI